MFRYIKLGQRRMLAETAGFDKSSVMPFLSGLPLQPLYAALNA